ncbi:MAG TPA: hypothetical protein VIF37_04410 [Methylobacter sp.]|jgi:hypothetical protein
MKIGENESHPLASLLNFVGMLVADYEQVHFSRPEASAQQVLALLIPDRYPKRALHSCQYLC